MCASLRPRSAELELVPAFLLALGQVLVSASPFQQLSWEPEIPEQLPVIQLERAVRAAAL